MFVKALCVMTAAVFRWVVPVMSRPKGSWQNTLSSALFSFCYTPLASGWTLFLAIRSAVTITAVFASASLNNKNPKIEAKNAHCLWQLFPVPRIDWICSSGNEQQRPEQFRKSTVAMSFLFLLSRSQNIGVSCVSFTKSNNFKWYLIHPITCL